MCTEYKYTCRNSLYPLYCMDVASTIAKLPFSISTVTLRYGEDDMSDLYSCISMKDKHDHDENDLAICVYFMKIWILSQILV